MTSLIFVVLTLFALMPAYAVPPAFNVQGKVADLNGAGYSAGDLEIKFSLFDSAAGGELLWTRTIGQIQARAGNFQVTLEDQGSGGKYQYLKDVFRNDTVYLEFQVLSGAGITTEEPPIVPRQRLVPVPAAMKAGQIRGKLFSKGMIVMWAGKNYNVPPGWCLCDGGTCVAPDNTQVKTPDLRDRFILGANSPAEIGVAGGSNDPLIDPPGVWSSKITGWTFYGDPGLTKYTLAQRKHYLDIPPFRQGPEALYPKYYKLAFIMKL